MPKYYEPSKDRLAYYLNRVINGYEVGMVAETAAGLATQDMSRVQTNTYVESFIIHSRNLYDFFSKERPRVDPNPDKQIDDVRARHYLPDWDLDKAGKNPVLKKYFGRGKYANIAALHLSAKRVQETEDGFKVMKVMWPWPKISYELAVLWKEFSEALTKEAH